jgi:hypothetical protein
MKITYREVLAVRGQHAAGDRQPARRYWVLVDGQVVGDVRTHSRESRTPTGGRRIAGRLRGYTRTWKAYDNRGEQVGWSDTRAEAVQMMIRDALRFGVSW